MTNEEAILVLESFKLKLRVHELKFNPNHVPSGRDGGQFTTSELGATEDQIRNQKHESAALFKDGKKLFFKDGEAERVGFTSEEIADMEGAVLTHNHPGGMSFSEQDVLLLNMGGMKEIRAVSKNVDYYLKSTGGVFEPETIKTAFSEATKLKLSEYAKAFEEGKITKAFANREFQHEVLGIVSKDLGYSYKRKIIDKAFYSQ